jgi:hypothetical protein
MPFDSTSGEIGHGETPRRPRRFFAGRRGIVQAVIAAEVLGKPRALGDEYFPR